MALKKYKTRVVQKDIFMQGTLSIDQKCCRSAEWQTLRELGARPGDQYFLRVNIISMAVTC